MKLRLLILCLLCLGVNCLRAAIELSDPPLAVSTAQSPDSGLGFVFDIYEHLISPIDGERCAMHPSCSQFAKVAIAQKGLGLGLLMSADRIMRCGMDTWLYPKYSKGEKDYYLDLPAPD